MKENDSSSVSRKESACNSGSVEVDGKQQQHGWKPDKYENRKQGCHVHCIAKEHEIHELNQQSVKYRTAHGDAILVSETWRSSEAEIWETNQGHIVMCAAK